MGSYYIPNNKLKGETRILLIFTVKSLIYTAVFGLVGLIPFFIIKALGNQIVAFVVLGIFGFLGFFIGTFKFSTNGTGNIAKTVGGESIDEVIKDYIKFKKNRKVYAYAVEKDENYEPETKDIGVLNFIDGIGHTTNDKGGEK